MSILEKGVDPVSPPLLEGITPHRRYRKKRLLFEDEPEGRIEKRRAKALFFEDEPGGRVERNREMNFPYFLNMS
jgi:hypothetical protein